MYGCCQEPYDCCRMSRLKRGGSFWVGLRLLFTSIVVFFLIRTIYTRWSQVANSLWQFRPIPLVASFGLQLAAALFWATVWQQMVKRMDRRLGWADGIRIYLLSNLVKYVPGSIWGYASRLYWGSELGLSAASVGISVIWETGLAVLASLLLTAITIPTYPSKLPQSLSILLWVISGLCFVALFPPLATQWMRTFQKHRSYEMPYLRWRDFFIYLFCAICTHMLVGMAFFLFIRSLLNVDMHLLLSFVGIWSLAATAGLVVVIAPHGLGVKEGVLVLLLQSFMPFETALAISLVSRLWTIAGEVINAIAALAISYYIRAVRT